MGGRSRRKRSPGKVRSVNTPGGSQPTTTIIWHQLSNSNGEPLPGLNLDGVELPQNATVSALLHAVHAAYLPDSIKCVPSALKVCEPGTMHELDPRTRLNTFDTEKYPLLVVVPEPAQPTRSVVPSVSLPSLLEKLQRLLIAHLIVVVCLPPGGGKSLFELLATERGSWSFIYVSLVDIDFVKFFKDLSQGRVTDSNNHEHSFNTVGNCTVWLEDAQTQFSQTQQWQVLVKVAMPMTRGVRFVISTTSLDDPPYGAALPSHPRVEEDKSV